MTKKLQEFFKTLEITPNDERIFQEALVHRSYVNESKETKNNERLEFLGDAVLELIVTEYLFKTYPQYPEGDLTSFRAAVVRTESLAEESLRLGVGKYILMSNGEEATGGRERPYILANTFEAIIGAMYLDLGYKSSQKFVTANICYKLEDIIKNRLDIDSKSKLQELTQEMVKITPAYELIDSSGPDHDKTFTMGVKLNDTLLAQGNGKNKQEAEQNAAQQALDNWEELYQLHFGE